MKRFMKMFLSTMIVLNAFSANTLASNNEENNSANYSVKNTAQQSDGLDLVSSKVSRPNIGDGNDYDAGTYNWVYSWDKNTMQNYNCYAFALGIDFGQLRPGDLSGLGTDKEWMQYDFDELTEFIIADLKNLNYRNVREVASSYKPEYGENKIAFRLGYQNGNLYDFHFMVYESENFWLYKPGATAILIYKNSNLSADWVLESFDGHWKVDDSIVYKGPIAYFAFEG